MNTQLINSATPIHGTFYPNKVTKTLTFDGGSANGVGDHDGTGDPADLFTVTGVVAVQIIVYCTTNLTFDANAAIEVGIGGGSEIIATTDLTVASIIAQELWHDATPDAEIELTSVVKDFLITDGNDIQLDTTVANVTAGVLEFVCYWLGISGDANVVAA